MTVVTVRRGGGDAAALAVRPMAPEDRTFVVGSFLDSYRLSNAAGLIAMEEWSVVMTRQIERIMTRSRVRTIVAACPGERRGSEDLYGWLMYEPPVRDAPPYVVYCYVKAPYRRLGVARALFRAAGIDPEQEFGYAARVPLIMHLWQAIPRARWSPLHMRFAEDEKPWSWQQQRRG